MRRRLFVKAKLRCTKAALAKLGVLDAKGESRVDAEDSGKGGKSKCLSCVDFENNGEELSAALEVVQRDVDAVGAHSKKR